METPTRMRPVTVYSRSYCPFCEFALALLSRKGAPVTVIHVSDAAGREEMIQRAGGRRTFPQIFVGETHVGGCDDLHALDRAGKLDLMLAN